MKRVFVSLFVMMLLVTAVQSAPTTKPAAKPDPNTAEVAFEELGFRFRIPKVWKVAAKAGNSASIQFPGGGMLVVAGPYKKDLKAAVDERKARLVEEARALISRLDQKYPGNPELVTRLDRLRQTPGAPAAVAYPSAW